MPVNQQKRRFSNCQKKSKTQCPVGIFFLTGGSANDFIDGFCREMPSTRTAGFGSPDISQGLNGDFLERKQTTA